MWTAWRRWEKNLQKRGENIWKRASGNRGKKNPGEKETKKPASEREQSFLQQSRKRHLNLLFHLGIWQLLQCHLLILSVSYFIHKSRGGRDDGRAEERESDRRDREEKKKEEHAKVLCFASVCRAARGLRAASFLTRLMMYGNVRYAGWLLTRGRPFGGSAISFPRRVSGILGHGEESDSLNVRQVWHPTSRRQQLYVWRGGFFVVIAGRRWQVQSNAWLFLEMT